MRCWPTRAPGPLAWLGRVAGPWRGWCWWYTADGPISGGRTLGLLQGGLINYAPAAVFAHGDNPAYPEYHWHGLQLLAGNLYVLAGLGLFVVMVTVAGAALRTDGRALLTAAVPHWGTKSGSSSANASIRPR